MNGIVRVNNLRHYNIYAAFAKVEKFHESCNMYLCVKDTDNKIGSLTRN